MDNNKPIEQKIIPEIEKMVLLFLSCIKLNIPPKMFNITKRSIYSVVMTGIYEASFLENNKLIIKKTAYIEVINPVINPTFSLIFLNLTWLPQYEHLIVYIEILFPHFLHIVLNKYNHLALYPE